MATAGMAGLEVDHRDHDDARAHLRGSLRVMVLTGSSDQHGYGKPIRIGEHTTTPEACATLLDRVTSGVEPVSACWGRNRGPPVHGL